jgi:hypothetical protein
MSISRLQSSPSFSSFSRASGQHAAEGMGPGPRHFGQQAIEGKGGPGGARCGAKHSAEGKGGAGAQGAEGAQAQQLQEMLQKLQELLKKLGSDGFDSAPKGAGGVGGAKGAGGAGGVGAAGGAGGAGGAAPQGMGGAGMSQDMSPPDLADESASPGSANADKVAQSIAQEATSWTYDHTAGKTFDQAVGNENNFDQSKSGICTDMAVEAAQRFEAAGIDARVVGGETDKGNHAWVEYKGADGEYHRFDPTAAATSKDASKAINTNDNGYNYGRTIETYNDVPAEV